MERRKKLIWGIFSIWPICWMILFMCGALLLLMGTGFLESDEPAPILFIVMGFIMIFHFATIIEIWVMIILYLIRIIKDESIEQNNKILWVILIFIGNIIAMPIFWYLYIWKEKDPNIIKK